VVRHLLIFNIGDLKCEVVKSSVIWPNSGFEADYDEIKLQNIVMTSSPLRH